ncbi:hypothetical protein [Chitinimonas sp.]|uniref:hypothetical protein n=1 Tax=Chitinimonas sp. TaxID=1934313 RepID=UPI002F92AABD
MHLPIVGKRIHSFVTADPARLYPLLAAPGSSAAKPWYGEERLIAWEDDILVLENEGFRRYVFGLACVLQTPGCGLQVLDPEHAAFGLAGLDVRLPCKGQRSPLVERIYVMPERRRQGIASALILRARRDFPNLALDGKLTPEGAALFGYALKH